MTPAPLILASGSPRRRELLQQMGFPFEVITAPTPELDETPSPHLAPTELARENARLKARAVAQLYPGRTVLGADTVVALGPRLFAKATSLDEARDFLRALSDQTHEVITGCALISGDHEEIFHDITRVTFLPLTDDVISRYLDAVHVLDKAGAYALQEHGDWIIARIDGSRTNVIGLPTEALEKVLLHHGLL